MADQRDALRARGRTWTLLGNAHSPRAFEKDPLGSVFGFVTNARDYIGLLRDHIRKEEKLLFPVLDARMSVQVQEQLCEEFGKIERSILNKCGKSLIRGEDGVPVLAASPESPGTPERGV